MVFMLFVVNICTRIVECVSKIKDEERDLNGVVLALWGIYVWFMESWCLVTCVRNQNEERDKRVKQKQQ